MHLARFLPIFTLFTFTATQWIDPHSMDSNRKTKLSQPPTGAAPGCVSLPKKCVADVHLRRIVRIILNNARLDNFHEGYINIKLSSVEHQLLVNFSQSVDEQESVFNAVSTIFERALQKPPAERYEEFVESLQDKLYHILFNPTSTALVSACLSLYLTYKLVKARLTWRSIIKYFAVLLYIIDFLITYLNIVKEDEVEGLIKIRGIGTAPPECDPGKMTWWQFIKTKIGSDDCRTYYLATYPNSVFLIGPSRILTRQFRTLIVEPCGDIGEGFGKFGRGMFTSLPFGLNLVLFPIMLVTVCGVVFMIFIFITKPHFKVSLFHLFTVELGGASTARALPSDLPRRSIGWRANKKKRRIDKEVGCDGSERTFVEEVSFTSSPLSQKSIASGESEVLKTMSEDPSQEESSGCSEGASSKA